MSVSVVETETISKKIESVSQFVILFLFIIFFGLIFFFLTSNVYFKGTLGG